MSQVVCLQGKHTVQRTHCALLLLLLRGNLMFWRQTTSTWRMAISSLLEGRRFPITGSSCPPPPQPSIFKAMVRKKHKEATEGKANIEFSPDVRQKEEGDWNILSSWLAALFLPQWESPINLRAVPWCSSTAHLPKTGHRRHLDGTCCCQKWRRHSCLAPQTYPWPYSQKGEVKLEETHLTKSAVHIQY